MVGVQCGSFVVSVNVYKIREVQLMVLSGRVEFILVKNWCSWAFG